MKSRFPFFLGLLALGLLVILVPWYLHRNDKAHSGDSPASASSSASADSADSATSADSASGSSAPSGLTGTGGGSAAGPAKLWQALSEPPAHFSPTETEVSPDAPNPALRSEPFYRRMRSVGQDSELTEAALADPEAFPGQRIEFDLFPDASWIGEVEKVEIPGPGRVNLFGTLEQMPGSDFIISLREGAAAMSFTTPGRGRYQVRTAGDGLLTAIELAPELLPPCGNDHTVEGLQSSSPLDLRDARIHAAVLTQFAADSAPSGRSYGAPGQQGGSAEGLVFTDVDVMVVFTGAARAGAGGENGVLALIDIMVARANSVFINSRVGLRLRLVYTEEVAYNEPNNIITDLDRLTDSEDGHLDSVHTTRQNVGADVVSMLTETTGGGVSGLAWLYSGGNGAADYGFNVVQRAGCESTFVHEIGHNFGCEHDRENTDRDEAQALYPYAFGHRFTPEGYPLLRTVMAYAPGDRVPYFSNPEVLYLGEPTGVAIGLAGSQAHNAQVLDNTKATLAAFRAAAGNIPPEVTLTHPVYDTPLAARDNLTLTADATDADGTVSSVHFYQLLSDDNWSYSNSVSTTLGSDSLAPYSQDIARLTAGYLTFAAVAEDNAGGVGIDTVSVTVNPWYRLTTWPMPEGFDEDLSLAGINEAGQVAGTVESLTVRQACRWTDGVPALLGFLPGDSESLAHAIAEDGTVFGESISGGGGRRACSWSPAGVISDLSNGVAGQATVAAHGRDEQGRILFETTESNLPRFYRQSTLLPMNYRGRFIASSGVVGGSDYDLGPSAWRAARWNGDSSQLLSPLASFAYSWGSGANRAGAVVGWSSPTSGGWSSSTARATLWAANSTTPVNIHPEGGTGSVAHAINDHREAVGFYHQNSAIYAFYWSEPSGSVPLEEVVMPVYPLQLTAADVINHRGQIAVRAWHRSEGKYQPALLTPVVGLNSAHWLRQYFSLAQIEDTGIAGDADDPDGDGLPNLIERAFGLNPLVAETSLVGTGYPEVGFDDVVQKLTLRFRKMRPPADISYTVESSNDLTGAWNPQGVVEISRSALDADWDEVVYQSVESPASGSPVFMRVRVGR